MALLPPVGWAEVATKEDLHQLEARLAMASETRFGQLDGRFGQLDGRFTRLDARFSQLEGQIDRSVREQTRTLMLGLVGAMFTMTSLCLGAVALAT